MAGRCGIDLPAERFDEISKRTPVLCNLKPAGTHLMEDFYYAGGLRGLLARIGDLLNLDCLTVNGRTLGENIAGEEVSDDDVIRTRDNPLSATGGTAVPRGNLAPHDAILQQTTPQPHPLKKARKRGG